MKKEQFFSVSHFAIPLSTVNCQLSTVNWTHTFSAKEKDSETGLSYFGSRYYSSDLSIWLSVDPMSDKYPSLSPYTYCANNPVKLVDPNGKDYETVIDKDSKTITIIALYYAADSDKEKLQKGIDAWNAQSGKYTYTIEDGENAGTYTINFELSINPQDGSNCPQDGISNSFSITSDNIEGKGQALSSNDIIVQEKSSERTIIHEIGHTIGIGDFTNGVMQSGGTSTKITKGHILKTLENAGFTCLGTFVGTQTVSSYSQSCDKNERIESVGNTVGYLRKRK